MHRIKIIVVAVINKTKKSPRYKKTSQTIPLKCPCKSSFIHPVTKEFHDDNVFWDNSKLWNSKV